MVQKRTVSLTRRRLLAAMGLVLIGGTELALSVLANSSMGPMQYHWKMFNEVRRFPEFYVVRPGGEERVDFRKYVAIPRHGVDYSRRLPPHLCRVLPDAERVVVISSDKTESYPCLSKPSGGS